MTGAPLTERIEGSQHALTKRLLTLIKNKKTNLGLSADVTHAEELIDLVDKLGPEICVLKTHIDIIVDFTPALTDELTKLAKKHDFLIFEDRKFADIGSIAQMQYENSVYRISAWADIVTGHPLLGPGMIQGLAEIGQPKQRGLLMLAELSAADTLLTEDYTRSAVKIAEQFPDFVMGFIAQRRLNNDPRWIYLTPGVKLEAGKDRLGQRYVTPELAIAERGSDIIIVGRGIIQAQDPVAEAQKYRQRGWQAYSHK